MTFSDYLIKEYGKTISQLRFNINYKNNEEERLKREYEDYCVAQGLKPQWYNRITKADLKKLRTMQAEIEDGEELWDWDIEKVIGMEHYFEWYSDRENGDMLSVWADPESFIVVTSKTHNDNYPGNEWTRIEMEQFNNNKDYNDYLFDLKKEIEASPYYFKDRRGEFTRMLASAAAEYKISTP